jgi:hypothetical protein
MLAKGQTCFNAMLGIGSRCGGMNPIIGSKIYWSNVIPAMLYGAVVMCLSHTAIERLEAQHRKFAKRLQRLPEKTANPLAYSTLGWESIQSYIAKQSLQFTQNIYLLKSSSVYKRVLIDRITDIVEHTQENHMSPSSPIRWFLMCCSRYGVMDEITEMLNTGVALSKETWKSQVKTAVAQCESFFHRAERLLYKNLGYTSPTSKMDLWWKVAFHHPSSLPACRLMVKIKLGVVPLQCNTSYYERQSPLDKCCKLCALSDEDTKHFLFDCIALSNMRQGFFSELCSLTDDGMYIINTKSVDDVVNPPVPENDGHNLMKLSLMAKSVYNMFLKRRHLLLEINNLSS